MDNGNIQTENLEEKTSPLNGKNAGVNRFRNASNTRYTRGLFKEQAEDKASVIYTLSDEDNEYPSLRKLYLACDDLTEYDFAIKNLDGLEHWDMLLECSWFKPFVHRWRRELKLKYESAALKEIIAEARAVKSPNKFQANKLIYDKVQEKPSKRKAGAPTRDEVKGELKREARLAQHLKDDMDRVRNAKRQ